MRSRAQFKAHPIHPALIPFPFAFLIGATVFDVLGMAAGNPEWSLTGGHLAVAGLISGVLAAIPGAVDFIYTVPPASSGKNARPGTRSGTSPPWRCSRRRSRRGRPTGNQQR